MNLFKKFAKTFTCVVVSASVIIAKFCVFASDVSLFDINVPDFQYTAQTVEWTESAGYISMPLGIQPSPSNAPVSTFSSRSVTLPTQYDMRDYGYVTGVKNQGSLGVCWTFSGLSNLESYILRHIDSAANPDFSENHLRFSMSRYASDGNWLWGDDRTPDSGGNFLYTTAYLARGGGPVNESDDPYQKTPSLLRTVAELKEENGIKEDLPIDIGDGNYLSGTNGDYILTDTTLIPITDDRETNIEKIKHAVYTTNAVDIGVFWNTSHYVSGANMYCDAPYLPNHEVNIIGWDDNYLASNFKKTPPVTFMYSDGSTVTYGNTIPEGNGAFLIKNSWGTTSGDSGYYWLSYYDSTFSQSSTEAYFVSGVSTNKYDNIYQYDPLVTSAWISLDPAETSTSVSAALFNAKYGETVSAAGFYTMTENSNYRIFVDTSVKMNENYAYIISDRPVLVAEGNISNAGYHTIEFDEVTVNASNFCIIVELTVLDSGVAPRIPLELLGGDTSGNVANSNASANAYETFFATTSIDSKSNNYLYDITEYVTGAEEASACIKAFTNDPEPDSGLSAYVTYDTVSKNGNAVFNLANNTGETQNAMCVTAVYKDGVLENAFTANAENLGSVSTATVPFTISSSDCVVKSMIFYEDSICPVTPKPIVRRSSYLPLSPDFATKKIYLKPGESKCVNIIDRDIDATQRYKIESSDTSIVSVNGGTITAGSAPGYTTITASYLTKTVTADVYVLY